MNEDEDKARDISRSDGTLTIPERLWRHNHALKASQLAAILQVSKQQIYTMIQGHTGSLPSFKMLGVIRFDPIRTAEWLEEQSLHEMIRREQKKRRKQ